MNMPRWQTLGTSLLPLFAVLLVAAGCGEDSFTPPNLVVPPGVDAGADEPFTRQVDECDPGFAPDSCDNDNDCDNRCFCDGVERCEAGTCVGGTEEPCADSLSCTEDVCFEELDFCFRQPRNERCSDGLACNGFEICNTTLDDGVGCEPGVTLFCNDEDGCTVDSCDDDLGCTFRRRDLDGDGFLDTRCGGDDCNDDPREGARVFPGAPENCTNRLDDNCDGVRDFNSDTCVPQNDSCDEARVLPGPGLYSASSKLLTGDVPLSCTTGGIDAIFAFTVPSGLFPGDLDAVDVTFEALGVPRGAVALRSASDCTADGTLTPEVDLRCIAGPSPSTLIRSLAPGDYVAVVNTATPVTSFDVRLGFGPPTPIPNYDVCDAGTEVIDSSGVYAGRFEETNHDYSPSCGFAGFDGERTDGAYRLVLTETSDVSLALGTRAPTALNQAVVAVYQNGCGDVADEGVCRTAPTAEWKRRGLPAGEYFIVIEARALDATSWELEVDITTPPATPLPGDACSTAISLDDGAAKTVILEGFEEDARPSCDTFFSSPPRDAIFTFTIDEPQDVTITTSVADDPTERFPQTDHTVTLVEPWEDCGLVVPERACINNFSSPINIARRSLPAGTYYVILTSDNASQLSATAQLEVGPATPVPLNDRCDGVVPEVCDDVFNVDESPTWLGFEDDFNGGSCVSTFITSVDGVFQCTIEERSFVSATVERKLPQVSGTAYVWIASGDCPGTGSTTSLACNSGFRVPVTATASAIVDPGTYWIVAESRDLDVGDYRLTTIASPLE